MPGAHNRTLPYLLKDDLDAVLEARSKRTLTPEYAGLVHVMDAAEQCGLSLRGLRYQRRAYGTKLAGRSRPGKSLCASAVPRAYVTQAFVDWVKARFQVRLGPDDITVRQAAAYLQTRVVEIYFLVRQRYLTARRGRILYEGGYSQEGLILSRSEVEARRRSLSGEIKPEAQEDSEGVWLPRPLVFERHPHITETILKQCTNKEFLSTGLSVRAKRIKWRCGFRYRYRRHPLGFLEEDLERLDRYLANRLRNGFAQPEQRGVERKETPVTSSAAKNHPAQLQLTDAQHAALTVLTRTPGLRGQDIAVKAGFDFDYMRHVLSELKKLDLVRSTGVGYRLTESGINVLCNSH
jgi:hypothetical protein